VGAGVAAGAQAEMTSANAISTASNDHNLRVIMIFSS
jgi:hypothetical protein